MKEYKTQEEIFEDFPNLEGMGIMDLIMDLIKMQSELRRFEEDRGMLHAVLMLIKFKSN